jgi:hypothetical protein
MQTCDNLPAMEQALTRRTSLRKPGKPRAAVKLGVLQAMFAPRALLGRWQRANR